MTDTQQRFTRSPKRPAFSKVRRCMLWLLGSLVLIFGAVQVSVQEAKEPAGSRDHPMISRFQGARIAKFEQKEFDEYRLVKGAVGGFRPDGKNWGSIEEAMNEGNSTNLEGRVWNLTYRDSK